jgi:hypothetical protein
MKLILVEKLNHELDDYTERVIEVYRYSVKHGEPAKIIVLNDQQELGKLALQYNVPKVDVISIIDVALGTENYEHGPLNFNEVSRNPLAEVSSGFRDGVIRDGALVYADLVYFPEADTRNRFVSGIEYHDSRGLKQDADYYDYRGFKFLTEQVVDGKTVSQRYFTPARQVKVEVMYLAGELDLIRWFSPDQGTLIYTSTEQFLGDMLRRVQLEFDGGFAMIERPQLAVDALATAGVDLSEQLTLGGQAYHDLFEETVAVHDGQRIGLVLNGGVKLADKLGAETFFKTLDQEKLVVNTGPAYGWVSEFANEIGATVVQLDKQEQTLGQLSAELFTNGDVQFIFQTNTHLDTIYRVNQAHGVLSVDLGTNIYHHDLIDDQTIIQEDLDNTTKLLTLIEGASK